jgi:hypothetical protein
MKNKEKAEKLAKSLEESGLSEMTMDLLLIQAIGKLTEEISDKKLQIKLEDFFDNLLKEFGERDLEEEAKVEFYCSECHKFLPLDKKAEGHYVVICIDCDKENKEEEEYEN